MTDKVIETAAEAAAQSANHLANTGNGITGASGAWAIWSGITLSNWGVIVGILGVILGTLITYYYKRKEVAIKRELAEETKRHMNDEAERKRQAFELQMRKEHGPNWRGDLLP